MKNLIAQAQQKVEKLQILIKEEAALYAAEEILDLEDLAIKYDEPIESIINRTLEIAFEVAEVGVDMNSLASAKRIKREARS